jgi:hypothetical protein
MKMKKLCAPEQTHISQYDEQIPSNSITADLINSIAPQSINSLAQRKFYV